MSKRTAVFAGEEIDRLGTCGQERIDAGGVESVAGFMAQIGPRLLGAFDDAPVARERGAGDPQPAAGARGGAAKARLLLDDQDVETVMARGDRRRHAGASRADHQHVAFVGFLLDVCHAICPAWSEAGIWKGMDFPVNRRSDRAGSLFPSPCGRGWHRRPKAAVLRVTEAVSRESSTSN